MKAMVCRLLAMAVLLSGALTFSMRAEAGLVVTLLPASGTDLSNVHVGDTLRFVTRGGTDVAPGIDEHLLSFPNVHLFGDQDIFDVFRALGVTGVWGNNLHSNPNLLLWEVRPNAAGTVTLYNGFSDCNGLPADTSGCAITNLGATRPDDSNRLTFTVHAVPEPPTLVIVGMGLLALGCCRPRKAGHAD